MRKRLISLDFILTTFIFVIVFLYAFFYARFHVDPHHDGIILKPAIDVYFGKHLFSETFTQYGALTTLIHVAFMKIFGPTLYAIRLSAVVFYALIATLLYSIWKRFLSSRMAFWGVVIWIVTAYFPNQSVMVPFLAWSSVYSLAFQLLTVWSLFRYLEAPRRSYLWLAGASVALAFWSRQPVGIFLGAAVTGFLVFQALVTRRWADMLCVVLHVVLGGLAVSSLFLVWLARTNALTQWYEQSIVLAFTFGNNLSGSFSLRPILATLFPSLLVERKNIWWNALPATTMLLVAWETILAFVYTNKTKRTSWQLLLLGIVGLASWLQYFPVSDNSHNFWAATPLIGIFLFVVPRVIHFHVQHIAEDMRKHINVERWSNIVFTLLACIMIAPFVVTAAKGVVRYMRPGFVTLKEPSIVKGLRVDPVEAAVLTSVQWRLQEYFSVHPDSYALNLNDDALYTLIDSHMKQFHVSPVYWDWASNAIWKDYVPEASYLVKKDRPVALTRIAIFGENQENHEFRNYCQIDLKATQNLRVQMYLRPLVLRVPTEGVVSVKQEKGRVVLQALFPGVELVRFRTEGREALVVLPVSLDTAKAFTVVSPAASFALTLRSKDFGECVYAQ